MPDLPTERQVQRSILAMMGGYAIARIEFPGKRILFVAMLASMMVPDQVLWIPNYATCSKLGWVNTYWALIPGVMVSLTSGIFLVSQVFYNEPEYVIRIKIHTLIVFFFGHKQLNVPIVRYKKPKVTVKRGIF